MRIGEKFLYCPKCGSGNLEHGDVEGNDSLLCKECHCWEWRQHFDEDKYERIDSPPPNY